MKAIYSMLQTRFRSNPTLLLVGRELVLGPKEDVRPWTEVNIEQGDDFSTFGSDIDSWTCEFLYHAKDLRTNSAHDWQEEMRTTFRSSGMTAPEFESVNVTDFAVGGPSESDGGYDASASFTVIAQRLVRNPVTVGT